MNELTRFRTAPVTTTEAKLNLFAPVDKIYDHSKYQIYTVVYEDSRNKVSVSGTRLTQIHRDILDIALFHGSYRIEDEIEQTIPVRTFSLYEIQKHLQYKNRYNNKWLIEKLQELKRATIVIYDKEMKEEIEFNIIRVAKRSDKIQEFILVFEELYFQFFEKQVSIDYKELLPDILSLKHPQTKAVVRYLLSHTAGHQINIDKALQKVGVIGGNRNLEVSRKYVLDELQEIGDKFNIEIIKTTSDARKKSDITLKYTRHKEVKIYNPQPTLF
jgi:hypothetical protein